jgi:hypothetical protein
VDLLAIAFNHDPLTVHTGAVNLRKNGTDFVTVPEWQRGQQEVVPVAYAIDTPASSTTTVRATFHSPEHAGSTVEVRAVPAPPPPIPELLLEAALARWALSPLAHLTARWYLELAWRQAWGVNADVLGEVAARSVEVRLDGNTGFEEFRLLNPRFRERGVGVHEATWLWQYRDRRGGAWRDMTTTSHQIYTLVSVPTHPWAQLPFDSDNTQLPWADVLGWACTWASGARTRETAAAAITRRVHELGPARIRYNCVNGGPSNYSFLAFDCTAFLDRMASGFGNGPAVNCSDCATIVSTFANAIGCDLWEGQMFDSFQPFPVNPVRLIGDTAFQGVCGTGFFQYHEVAWTGDCEADDKVFDACLEIALLATPLEVAIPLLPVDLTFGVPGSGNYRDRLAAPAGRLLCRPRPENRQRRFVF